jgi:hypothetical protein
MNTIDQNIVLRSLNHALVPGASLVDGRTERDRLAFFADFASLINFFDHTNTIKGSWRPFILKDPVFLLAHISATRFHNWHTLYRNELARLSTLSAQQDTDIKELGAIINHLLDQLTDICMCIERWTFYMQQSFDYDLKRYVLREVKNNFSEYFWALMAFRDMISRCAQTSGIFPTEYFLFESYDEINWKQSRGRRSYWEVMNINENLVTYEKTEAENLKSCYPALDNAGKFIFDFLHTIVKHSPHEYERVKKTRSRYPDTTLLRTFEKLLRIYQDGQNNLSNKHLQFYYRDILKQTPRQAVADEVYISANLAGKNAVYCLAAGTVLDAGTDAQNNPATFIVSEETSLNPATILNAYTIAVTPVTETLSTLFLQAVPNPALINKDEQGKITGWETFGGSAPMGAVQVSTGFVLASPILLLQEGDRTITCKMVFKKEVSLDFLSAGNYYLSTQNAWLDVTMAAVFTQEEGKQVTLSISLPASQPPIVPYPKNPEGINSQWPMFKMEFNYFTDPSDPPVLTAITIDVKATKLKTFQLFNDSGGLSSKTPFPLFGTIPSFNSNFIIGNAEIFSKPLQSFYMELAWDSLPALTNNFQTYYQPYNDYIAKQTAVPPPAPAADNSGSGGILSTVGKAVGTLLNPVKKIIKGVGHLIGKIFAPPGGTVCAPEAPTIPINTPFNNVCFTTGFFMLDTHEWNPLNLVKMDRVIALDGDVGFTPYINDTGCVPVAVGDPLLFSTQTSDTISCGLEGGSYFGIAPVASSNNSTVSQFPFTPDPAIQQQVLKYSDQSSAGFIKMTLTGPSYGFGSSIYANVVADIALKNALIVSKESTTPETPLNNPANPPFVPKVAGFMAHYSASTKCVFDPAKDNYPVQCFLFSPMANGVIYDNSPATSVPAAANISSMPGAIAITTGVPLYPAFPYTGTLFLEMDSVIAPAELSLYFQLARSYGKIPEGKNCHFFYSNNIGWNNLPLLLDGTNQFSCSGIVKVDIPSDMSNTNVFMGVNKYWISIGVTGDPALFSNTVFLKTNGFSAYRSGTSFLSDLSEPVLAPGIITKPVTAIPQVASLLQPFASFGGKAAENDMRMNQRVSNRLKTKDRAATAEDFYRLVRFHYPDIFYVKTVFDNNNQTTGIYVVKSYDDTSSPNVFVPLITECREEDICTFLQLRTSVFSGVTVSNFDLQFLQVNVEIEVEDGFESDGVFKKINEGLNLFLSPWITTDQSQIKIDQGVSDAQVAAFIGTIDGVLTVADISFQSWTINKGIKKMINTAGKSTMLPADKSTLFVSAMNHTIQITQNSLVAV